MSDEMLRLAETLAPAIVGGLVGYVSGRSTNNAQAKKILAEANNIDASSVKSIEDSYAKLIDKLDERISILETRIASLEGERDAYRKESISLGIELGEAKRTIVVLQDDNRNLEAQISVLEGKVRDLEVKSNGIKIQPAEQN